MATVGTEVGQMIVVSIISADLWVASMLVAAGIVLVFVLGIVVAKAGADTSEHQVHAWAEAYRCTCGETFPTEDAAMRHAERRRDEAEGPVEDHPHLGHPMR
jgi:hypothetical protein